MFHALIKTFYNPSFYTEARNERLRKPVLLTCFVALLYTLVYSALFAISLLPKAQTFLETDFVNRYYPEGLEVYIQDGRASSNVEEPYFIPLPQALRSGESDITNLVVINTAGTITLEQVASYDAFAVLDSSTLFIVQSKSETRAYSLAEVRTLTVTKDMLQNVVAQIMPWLIPLSLIFAGIAIVGMVLSLTTVQLLLALVVGVIAYVVARVRRAPATYGQAYKLAVYSLIPVFIFNLFLLLAGMGTVSFLILLLLATIVLVANISTPLRPIEKNVSSEEVREQAPIN